MEASAADLQSEEILTRLEVAAARQASYAWGIGFFVFDAIAYACGIHLALTAESTGLSVLGSLIAGFSTSGLLIVAHDACHQSLTPDRRLNRVLGTIAFLPALHTYSLWRHGHNFLHHLHTNIRGLDYVWEPLSPSEYSALPAMSKLRYRFFRSLPGHYFYYMFEICWKRRFIPRKKYLSTVKKVFWTDFTFVVLWICASSYVLILLYSHSQNIAIDTVSMWPVAIFKGILLPCCISQMLMSNTEYLHHTHPAVRWFRDPTEESFDDHQARVSIHVQYPQPIDWFVHWIMDHTAYHMQPTIPLYRLNATQAKIDSRSENTVQYHFKFSKLLKITRQCKLFDDETGNWTDFKGQPTGVTSELGD